MTGVQTCALPICSIGKGDSGLRTFSKFRAERLDASDMSKAGLNETCETLETVRIDGGTGCNVPSKYRDYRGRLKVRNHVHANSTGGSSALFHGHQNESRSSVLELPAPPVARLARRQSTCHQPLPRRARTPERHSPLPGGVCEASSTRSRSRKGRVGVVEAERIRRACQWSSDTPPRTSGSVEFWSGEGPSVPDVNETWCRHLAHWWRLWFTSSYAFLCPHRGQVKPSGQRHDDRYCWQASSVAKSV